MAKLGEGDKRWIVEERSDGTNVHNWHWTEKDCLGWARQRFEELLVGVKVLEGQGQCWISTTALDCLEGEAYVNIRKGKIIPGYELKVRLSWRGEVRDSSGAPTAEITGKIEFPYIADENSAEDPELTVSVKESGSIANTMREAMLAQGKPLLLQRVRIFVKEMSQGGPAKQELEAKSKGVPNPGSDESTAVKSSSIPTSLKSEVPKKDKKDPKSSKGLRTLALVQKFHCRQQDLYETLMDEKRWMAFTQSKARISNEIGGTFSLFDGAVTGVNQKLQPPGLIVQKWRFSSWPDGHYSKVCITIEEPENGIAVLKLTHSDIPEEDRFGNATVYDTTERGWNELIFFKIRAVFGYGL